MAPWNPVLVLIVATAGITIAAGQDPAASDRPGGADLPATNFLVILADDLGYGDLSCYQGWIETPQLDRLASEGLRFTDFHSNGAVCSPTRAALMTGRYPQRAGLPMVVAVTRRHLGLQPEETTLAECLGRAGYRTGVVGKWHLGYEREYHPRQHGFDLFRGYLSGNVDYFSHVDQAGVYDWWHDEETVIEEGYSTDLITEHALSFIDRHREEPFFLYVAHEAPHYPYQGPRDAADRTIGGQFPIQGSRADRREAYREMVQALDQSVGQIRERLIATGLADRTLVFFLSDNGANRNGSNGPLRGFKGSLYEGGHRVPAIAWWPGRVEPAVTDATSLSFDLFPTLLGLAGTDPPDDVMLDGINLAGLLLEGQTPEPRAIYWQHGEQIAVREGPWKCVIAGNDQEERAEVYDLGEDPSETTDVGLRDPRRLDRMTAMARDWLRAVNTTATRQPPPDQPPPRPVAVETSFHGE